MSPVAKYVPAFDDLSAPNRSRDELNQKFSNPEQVKKFALLPRDFTVDDGELTPTLKIKRKPIAANWAAEIESLYADA